MGALAMLAAALLLPAVTGADCLVRSVAARPVLRPAPKAAQAGASRWFRGWLGEAAVLRQEDYLEDGRIRVSYLAVDLGGAERLLGRAKTVGSGGDLPRDPPGLRPGKVLIKDHKPQSAAPKIVFRVEADPAKTRSLEEALARWWKEGAGRQTTFPVVPATLRIDMAPAAGPPVALWREATTLTAWLGETGYNFEPPRLRFAVLSPSGATLCVELMRAEQGRYVQIPMPRNGAVK